MTTILQPFHCDLQTTDSRHAWNFARRYSRTQRRNQFAHETTPAAPAAHTRYLSSPPAATLHGTTKGFVLRLPPQNKAPATLMQPLQCILQHHVANPHLSLGTWQHQMTTILQPVHCDLQPQIQDTHGTTHAGTAEHRGGTNSRMKKPQPHPPHTRGTFHRRLQPLYTEKHKVSCSGFLPKTKPQQHSCSHYNAFCSITWLTRISLRTWQHQMTTILQPFHCDLQPQIQDTHGTTHAGTAEHRGGTNSRMKKPQPHPPHTRGTFHRRLQPLYTEKHKVSCSGFLPKTKPQQHSCSHYNAFCSITWLTRISLRTWQHQMTTILRPFHCDL